MSMPVILPQTSDAQAPASTRAELGALTRLAAPLVGANLLQMGVYAIDVVFVSRLGTIEFAAATLGVYLYATIMFALQGLVGAAAPIIAAELGARPFAVREVRRSFRMAMWLSAVASLPFMVLLLFGERVLLAAGQDPLVAARAGSFLTILLLAMIPSIMSGVMRITASALGRPGWAMAVAVLGLATTVFANWVLVFGNLGAPALGLEGSAIASVITTFAMFFAYAAILVIDRRLRRFHLFGRWWRTEWSRMLDIVRLGIPIALTMTFEGALFGGAALLMGLIGVAEVAAHAIALNIAAIAFQVPYGVAQAATIRVGMAYGAGDPVWIGRAGRVAFVVGVGFMVVTALLMWVAPRWVISAYVDVADPANAVVVALAIEFLAVAAIFQLVDGAQAVGAGVLRGLQDTRVPMIIAGLGYWVAGFGTAILLGFGLGWEGVGIWTGLAVGLLVVSLLLMWRWKGRARLGLLPIASSRSAA
jgi:MATE family multidrug resistance protein